MGRSQESFNKKEVRNKKEKKRKDKEKKRLSRKDNDGKSSLDDMIAYVDENGQITSTPPDPGKKTEVELEDIEISTTRQDPSEKQDTVRKGIVAYFSDARGYGFIRDLTTQESFFVHINNTLEEIKEGNQVSFEVGRGPKGPIATGVKVLK